MTTPLEQLEWTRSMLGAVVTGVHIKKLDIEQATQILDIAFPLKEERSENAQEPPAKEEENS